MNEIPANIERLARWLASQYFLPGADRDDVEQIALIGAWEAVNAHDPELGTLYSFARLVISRRLRDAVREANRLKHAPLTAASSLDVHEPCRDNVADLVEARAQLREIRRRLGSLSELERRAIGISVRGECYWRDKQIDNALQRARRKLAGEAA